MIVSIISCNNDTPLLDSEPEPELDSCEFYATGFYNDTLPGKIPHKFWPCMSTEDLVEAGSYNFPSIIMLTGTSSLQQGYDLCRKKYSWFVELEGRTDAVGYLIAKYVSIDTVNYNMELDPYHFGGYKYYTYCLETFLAQEAYLKHITDEQRLTLLDELFIKQEVRKGDIGWFAIEGPTFAMSRVMYFYGYQPLLDSMEQSILIKNLVEYGNLFINVEDGAKAQSSIFNLTTEFINELKTKSE